MYQKLIKLLSHDLIKGSTVLLVGSLAANFLNYLFHVITGRMLGPEGYSVIAALISLFYVINFPASILNTIITRKVATLSGKNQWGVIKTVFLFLLNKVALVSGLLLIFFYFFQQQIAEFLKIDNSHFIVLLVLSYVFSLVSMVSLATLQGLLRFTAYTVLLNVGSVLRDAAAIVAIYIGWGVEGVLWAMVVGSIVMLFTSFIPLRDILKVKATQYAFHLKSYFSSTWIVLALLGLSLMINTDVLLVKHFFPAYEAGLYAALGTLGKVIFFASSSIGTVLLPLAAKKHASGASAHKDVALALAIISAMSIGLIGVYALVPKHVINLFYGDQYFSVAPLLPLIGIYFLFYNIAHLLTQFFVAQKQTRILLVPFIISLVQVISVYLFHDTFTHVLLAIIINTVFLTGILGFYYLKNYATAG